MYRPVGLAWRSHTVFIFINIGIVLFSDLFLFNVVVPILPFLLEERANVSHSHVQSYVSVMLTVFSASQVAFSPVVAWAADRVHPRKALYLFGLFLLAAATALLFTARTVPLLIASRIMQGASGSIVWVMGMTICCETVGPEDLGKAIASIFSIIAMGTMFAPGIGGSLYHFAGIEWVAILSFGILVVDLIMRLLVIEKKDACKYFDEQDPDLVPNGSQDRSVNAEEQTPLLPDRDKDQSFEIVPPKNPILAKAPILCCLQSSSMVTSLAVIFWEAILLSTFNATVPIHVRELFGFNAFTSGLVLVPVGAANCIFGPVAGWSVDRFGTKLIGTIGCTLAAAGLVLLCIPVPSHDKRDIVLYVLFLGISGIGAAIIETPGIVESIVLVKKFHEVNPSLFGENGPYMQHNAMASGMFALGTSLGPLISGGLTTGLGYSSMTCIIGGLTGVMAIATVIWLGGKPRRLQKEEGGGAM